MAGYVDINKNEKKKKKRTNIDYIIKTVTLISKERRRREISDVF